MPAIAPGLLTLFQKREKRMMGPKVAPKPDHAKETTSNITLFSSQAITMPNTVMSRRTALETCIICLSVAFFLITLPKIFLETAEAAISR